jgi:hypothetical protein
MPLTINAMYVGDDGHIQSTARQFEAEASAEMDEKRTGHGVD